MTRPNPTRSTKTMRNRVGTTLVSRTPGGGARALVARGFGLVGLRKSAQLAVESEREHQSERADENPGWKKGRNGHDGHRRPGDQRKQDHRDGEADETGKDPLVDHGVP